MELDETEYESEYETGLDEYWTMTEEEDYETTIRQLNNWTMTEEEDYETEVMADQGNGTLTEEAKLPKLLESIQDTQPLAIGITGQADIPTLPEAIQLFQLESMNKLRQTIQEQESVIAEQQERIAELENDVVALDEVMDALSDEFTQLREDFEAKTVDTKLICEAEKAHLREEFALEILTTEAKYEEERRSIENKNSQESERMSTKLHQCEITIVYMGNVMMQINEVMSHRQSLVEAQATTIREADEEIERQRKGSFICEAAARTAALQAEAIALLRSSLAGLLDLPKLSTANLEQLDVAPFMLELMESYNKQTAVIENLKSGLEKERLADESMSSIAEGLANLTSIMISATINLDIVDQQAQVIEKQGKLIEQLTPLLQNTSSGIMWYEKAEAGKTGIQSVSSCGCLPRSPEPTNVVPAKIEYHCGELSNRC